MTQSGVKDMFLDYFWDKTLTFISKLPKETSQESKQNETDKYVKEELLEDVYSLVWRIKGVCLGYSLPLITQFLQALIPIEILQLRYFM